jgi:outer membrane protein TolC
MTSAGTGFCFTGIVSRQRGWATMHFNAATAPTRPARTVMPSSRRLIAIALPAALLAGCQSYAPLPLDPKPKLARQLADLDFGPASAGWGRAAIDPGRPLGIAAVSLLAVENNPDLTAARAAHGVAEAQALQAGLLPNPSMTSQVTPILGGPGSATGWMVGFSQDVKALVTLNAARRGAAFAARQVDADLLWQEWQLIGKVRLLVVDVVEGDRVRDLLAAQRRLFAERYRRSSQAVAQGNLPLSAAAPDLSALSDLDKTIGDLDRPQQTRRHDLNALLGLGPEVELRLAADIPLPPLDPAAIERQLLQLPDRRPDLLALQLGYAAQEEKLRGAILAQFPTLVIGVLGGSDTTSVLSGGPSVTLDLPVFNHNQGNIAIERATREKLRDEFTARLTTAVSEVKALRAAQALIERQLVAATARLPQAEAAARDAEAAYRAGNLDERGYVDLVTALLTQRQNILALEQALLEGRVATATLVGAGMPVAAPATSLRVSAAAK